MDGCYFGQGAHEALIGSRSCIGLRCGLTWRSTRTRRKRRAGELCVRRLVNIRDVLGVVLLVTGITIFPFGYWVSVKWYFVALLLAIVGAALFFSERISRRFAGSRTVEGHIDPPVLTKELRGFPGAKIESHEAFDITGDADGD